MLYKHPIVIEKWSEDLEDWETYFNTRSHVNKTGGNEYVGGGAIQSTAHVTFEVRYCKQIAEIEFHTQYYRIRFGNAVFDIKDYDDFEYKHRNIKLIGGGKSG